MRIGCLQFAPQVGDVDNNLNRADAVLSRADLGDLDLLVLPELAFSGYNFKSLEDITPFLEPSGSGITSLWARTIALKYNCVVTVGYPEKVDVTPRWPTGPEYYNSVIVVNGDGETIANYRKSFLHQIDETWALEGNRGFYDGFIPGLGNTSIGICMDINPYKFEAPWHAFEFAFHILEVESNLVIVSMAWMTREDPRRFTRMPNEPDMETLTYWVTRLEPLIRSDNQDEILVVFCNRCGKEDEALYAGTSAVIGIHDGEVKVYGLLGRGERELLFVDTSNPPYAKLVHRPEVEGSDTKASSHLEEPTRPTDDAQKQRRGNDSNTTLIEKPSEDQSNNPPNLGSLGRQEKFKSPTRPRLIIPESPPTLPQQYPLDHPISAVSLRSENSTQSDKSNQSRSSMKTVRANPRPPERSTPYPDSGAPLSGYPASLFPSEKRIYGGHVTIESAGPFSPETPFEDVSPTSPEQHYWGSSDKATRTPLSGGGWTSGTPIGRKAEPFPWSNITGNIYSRDHNSAGGLAGEHSTSRGFAQAYSQSSQSSSSSDRLVKSDKSTRSGSYIKSHDVVEGSMKEDRSFARPSSPKSRNASCSRMRERTGSALGNRETNAAISLRLEGISLRAVSASRTHVGSSANNLAGEHVQSPPFSDSSRTRISEVFGPQAEQHTIPIAASPSILDADGRGYYQLLSRAAYHRRSNSAASTQSPAAGNDIPKSAVDMARPAPRAISRGRVTEPKSSTNDAVDSVLLTAERASSADSIRNDGLQSRARQYEIGNRPFRASGNSPKHNRFRRVDDSEREFERVEAVVCPNCPVHGQRSSSNETEAIAVPATESLSSPDSSPTPRPVSSASPPRNPHPVQAEPHRTSSGDTSVLRFGKAVLDPNDDAQSSPHHEAGETSGCPSE